MNHVVLAIDDATRCPVVVVDAAGSAEDALRMCSAIRSVSSVPIIVLSARDDSEERIRGLDAGADDYLVTPLNPRELRARIKVVARRASFAPGGSVKPTPRSYRFGKWRLDVPSHTLHHADGAVRILTAAEFQLLEALVQNARQVLPRDRYGPSVEVRMSRMRRLLRSETLIRSVYGVGYIFDSPVETDYQPAFGSEAS
jgi:two-component system, OmpR family, response regulator